MESYDFLIAGGGAAGLSLAFHLQQSSLRDRSICIVDKDAKDQNDRTWCFWSDQPTPYSPILSHSWRQIRFTAPGFDRLIPLGDYRYHMIRGLDFYRFTRSALEGQPNVHFVRGEIGAIQDLPDAAQVWVNGEPVQARFVFDSRLGPKDLQPNPIRYHYLKQHFLGWTIETDRPIFDPATPTLFDFRTPQAGAMRFLYILPESPTRALVEYTLFSANLLSDAEYERGLTAYLEQVLCLSSYRILEREHGIIPMTDHPLPRQAGRHVLNIGTRGGRVKPSTGYAFHRIQQDSAAIVASLEQSGQPFDIPTSPRRYALYDSILLQIMLRHPDDCAALFTRMFRNNPTQRLFRFLDERGPFGADLALMATLPPARFLQAWFRLKILHQV